MMSNYKVMIDSSVWIEYFKRGVPDELDILIREGLACINEIIYTELAPVLMKQKQSAAIEGLASIDRVPLNIDWEIVRNYQLINLEHGINNVGIPDIIILQQVIDQKITLFSLDKHFILMQEHLNFELFALH